MVNYKYKDLFWKSHVDKQLRIATDDELFVATNEDIHFEDFELTESLCSDSELRFGSCEASMVKFQVRNAFIPLSGKRIAITETLDGNTDISFQCGRYKVFSDVPTADKEYRDIVAYDSMYDILNAEMHEWYNSILLNSDSTVTMKAFRESFINYFGLEAVVPEDGLVNDDMIVTKTIQPEEISGKDIITAICEINGCFGHIGRDGKFRYIYLQQDIQGLYPADFLYPDKVPEEWNYLSQYETGHLYPQDPKGQAVGNGRYIKCQYEDYVVRTIGRIQIRQEENDIGVIYGNGENCYIIEDNFFVYGKGAEELTIIAENIYEKIRGVVYRPFSADLAGNPCLEVGDSIRISTKNQIVESYVFSRVLNGIQGLRDSVSSKGQEYRSIKVNSVQKSIVQLKGKTNTLERTVEETKSELKDEDAKLQSQITQTASEIRSEVSDMGNGLQSQITQTASEISLKVSKGSVSSEISMENGTVNLKGNRVVIESTNFSLSEDGTIHAVNGTFDGTVKSASDTSTATVGSGYVDVSLSDGSRTGITGGAVYTKSSSGDTLMSGGNINASYSIYAPYVSASNALQGNLSSSYIVPVMTSAGNVSINGSVNLATGAWVRANFQKLESSDFRLKRDLHLVKEEETERLIQFLDRLKLYRYRFKDKTEDQSQHYGMLAQEVLSAMQEIGIDTADQSIVSEYETRSYKDEGMYTGGKAYRVNYLELLKLLIPAYQSLRSEVEELRSEVVALKGVIK